MNGYAVTEPRITKAEVASIDGFIRECATRGEVFLVLFPHIRSANGIVRMLDVLRGGRWDVQRLAWKKEERRDALPVAVNWSNDAGQSMSVMGFAPLLAMPATRRAPYVAFAVWGGGNENGYRNERWPGSKTSKRVGIVDVPFDDDTTVQSNLWDLSVEGAGTLLKDPPEDAEHLRKIAFCIPRRVVPKGWLL